MAMMTGGNAAVGEAPWSRAIGGRASARGLKCACGHNSVGFKCRLKSARTGLRQGALLGVTGRAWAAHVMQFRPVGVERPDEELVPEIADFGQEMGASIAAFHLGGELF